MFRGKMLVVRGEIDIICNFYVYYTVSLYYYVTSNKQQQIAH
jgi:hypothetical protein